MATYRGTAGRDILRGGVSNDFFYAYSGNDVVYASSGHDTVYGGTGNDVLYGQVGNDRLLGETGADVLYGGIGNDILDGGVGSDRMYGGTGNDRYFVNDPGDQVVERVGEGRDVIQLYVDRAGYTNRSYVLPVNVESLITSGGSNETIFANDLSNSISLGRSSGSKPRSLVYGRDGNDYIRGRDQDDSRDQLRGDDGNDRLEGRKGNDSLFGGAHNDQLFGGNGFDHLRGDAGNDWLYGGNGRDSLVGYDRSYRSHTVSRHDRDTLIGGAGGDIFELAQHSAGSMNRNPYAYGVGYAIVKDFNRFEDKIRLTWRGNMDGFRLGTGDYDGNGQADTGIFYSGQGVNNGFIGYIENNTGLSLNASYFY